VFVYWYGPVLTGTKSIRLLVLLGSDRSTVGPGRNRLLGNRTVLTWLAVELSNSRSTEWYILEWLELFVYCGPVRAKIKWSVPINENTLYIASFTTPACEERYILWVCSFIGKYKPVCTGTVPSKRTVPHHSVDLLLDSSTPRHRATFRSQQYQ
jgi:hypothetical protein